MLTERSDHEPVIVYLGGLDAGWLADKVQGKLETQDVTYDVSHDENKTVDFYCLDGRLSVHFPDLNAEVRMTALEILHYDPVEQIRLVENIRRWLRTIIKETLMVSEWGQD